MQALWMVLASFWFALMAVGIKYASNSFGTFELVFYRGLVSMVFMAIVVRARGATLSTPVPMMWINCCSSCISGCQALPRMSVGLLRIH